MSSFCQMFPRVGGRIQSVRPREDEAVVELGATCIHGATPENPVYRLATEWGMADSLAPIDRCGRVSAVSLCSTCASVCLFSTYISFMCVLHVYVQCVRRCVSACFRVYSEYFIYVRFARIRTMYVCVRVYV